MKKAALEKRMQRLLAKKAKLAERCQASTDAAEVRDLTEQLEDVNAEIAETQEELDAVAAEEAAAEEARSNPPAGAPLVNGSVVAQFGMGAQQTRADEDIYASMEYRKAFMKYAQTGEIIPAELNKRDGAPANTDSLGATIPTTVLNEFINLIRKRYGNLYDKVRKLNIKGAVKVPISELQATLKWVTEDTVSPRQDGGKIKDFVEFSYNMAEIRVSQSLLSSIVTLDLFEREIVRIMMIAYMQAMDTGIVKGTGNGQMLGDRKSVV